VSKVSANADSYIDNALKRTSGDYQKADWLLDCSYWEYYYRITRLNKYAEDYNESLKKK
jgi:hypothetical protein